MKRLHECEKMLVALELAGWLNEANLALQAVVQCYGLLAPLIFYKIPSVAVVQVRKRAWGVGGLGGGGIKVGVGAMLWTAGSLIFYRIPSVAVVQVKRRNWRGGWVEGKFCCCQV